MGFFSKLLESTPMGLGNAFFGKDQNSNAAANKYLEQIPGMAHKNLDPYNMPGEKAQSFIDQIMKGYTPSEGYNFKKAEMGRELSNTAAAGGYAGGEYDQNQRAKLIQGLLGGDMQQYLQNVLGVHNNSYNAASQLTDVEGNALNQQGGMAFGQAENKNQRLAALRNALLQMGGQAAGFAGGGGFGGFGGGGGSSTGAQGWGQQALFGNNNNYGRGTMQANGSGTPGSAFGSMR